MTFEQFQATRQRCDDLGNALDDCRWDEEPPATGFLYLGCPYIENVQDHWPEAARRQGRYCLHIGNQEWISDDLESLEQHLFEFAVDEGYGNGDL